MPKPLNLGKKEKEMKTITAGLVMTSVCLIVISLVLTEQSSAKTDPKNAVAIWLLNGIEGGIVKDSSQNQIDGQTLGNPKLAEGKFGKALELNGSADYVSCGDNARSNLTSAITVVGWMKTTSISRWNVIAAKEIWDQKKGWILYINTSAKPSFAVSSVEVAGATSIALNTWYHFAGVVDDNGSVKLYINGEQDGTGNSKLTSADIDLRIGSRHPNAGGAGIVDPFPGTIDEVAIFDVAMTQDDIKSIMTDGLEKSINLMSVFLSGKLTNTWGEIKTKR
ncbi:MAG: large repetitive protein [Candidatus Poribacteria bacterium]|nr:large repetitive protein [Candidatus Poribacteria bacterium]